MAQPQIKHQLESLELSVKPSPTARKRLSACLASDPQHIKPKRLGGDSGDHVKVIQDALNTLRQRLPDLGLLQITDAPGTYGDSTAKAVKKYKAINNIIRTGQALDDIVGRMTITQIDNDLLQNRPQPAPTPPPVKADIKVVSADLKRTLTGDDDRHLEFLARLFEDDRIIDTGSGNELQSRLNTILAASSDGSNNGVTHFAGIFIDLRDRGFRKAFKDPFPGLSDNQVGHFMTAVDMGFRPSQTLGILPDRVRNLLLNDPTPTVLPKEEIICVRLIVGHEQVGDDSTFAAIQQAESPTNAEVRQFVDALPAVTASPNQDINRSRAALLGIRIGTGQGNSFQDLHLSLFGFKFGKMIRQGTITTRGDAALWIRTNIGTFLPDPIPPGPPTG